MNWLIWKEYRVNRAILSFGVLMVLLPYLSVLCIAWYNEWSTVVKLARGLNASSFYSLVFGQLVLTLLGGNAFAGEPQDRS